MNATTYTNDFEYTKETTLELSPLEASGMDLIKSLTNTSLEKLKARGEPIEAENNYIISLDSTYELDIENLPEYTLEINGVRIAITINEFYNILSKEYN